jgi:hypothetical protein
MDIMYFVKQKGHNQSFMIGEPPQTIEFWDAPPAKKHRVSFEGEHYSIDPERAYHSPALYAIWNSKSWMLQQTARESLYGSERFFWVDAGAWR